MKPQVLLVNPNLMKPPIAPIGLEYVASGLIANGYEPTLCDLAFADDWRQALSAALEDVKPVAIGVSIRNIDDAYFASQDFILEKTAGIVKQIKSLASAPVVIGGIGFSCAPREILAFTGADYGIAGEGEQAFPMLLDCLAVGRTVSPFERTNSPLHDIPGAVFRAGAGIVAVPPKPCDLKTLPLPSRRFTDNERYFAEGGQGGIETKRGCPRACIYCVDPIAQGRTLRLRSPEQIVVECIDLLDQDINMLHFCDTEFNLDPGHVHAVCDAFVRFGIASEIRWYVYASPAPFDDEMAQAMARAGCAGINFGADHADPQMLRSLGRNYGPDEIRQTARACQNAGLALMFDMLLGAPGETRESIARAIDLMRDLTPDRVGLSCGVRVYPHTRLAEFVRAQGPAEANPNLHGAVKDNPDFLRPIFYVDQAIGLDIHDYVSSLVNGDSRFLHANPNQIDGNYNYNDNSVLSRAIQAGERGAYWDILRRLA